MVSLVAVAANRSHIMLNRIIQLHTLVLAWASVDYESAKNKSRFVYLGVCKCKVHSFSKSTDPWRPWLHCSAMSSTAARVDVALQTLRRSGQGGPPGCSGRSCVRFRGRPPPHSDLCNWKTILCYKIVRNLFLSLRSSILKVLYSRHCTRFEKHESVLVGKLLGLLIGHLASALQIGLVANEKDHSTWVCEITRVGEPAAQVIVRGAKIAQGF